MSAHAVFLAVHVTAGSAGLVLGPVLMLVPKRRGFHTRLGETYHWVFLALFLSAVALAILNPAVWWLGLVGAFSYAFAALGYAAAKRRRPGWLVPHVIGQGGSYIAMVSALLTVNWKAITGTPGIHSFVPFTLPTLIGSPIIALVLTQVRLGNRPKEWVRRRVLRPAPRAPRGSPSGA